MVSTRRLGRSDMDSYRGGRANPSQIDCCGLDLFGHRNDRKQVDRPDPAEPIQVSSDLGGNFNFRKLMSTGRIKGIPNRSTLRSRLSRNHNERQRGTIKVTNRHFLVPDLFAAGTAFG